MEGDGDVSSPALGPPPAQWKAGLQGTVDRQLPWGRGEGIQSQIPGIIPVGDTLREKPLDLLPDWWQIRGWGRIPGPVNPDGLPSELEAWPGQGSGGRGASCVGGPFVV